MTGSLLAAFSTLLPLIFLMYVVAVAIALIYDDRDPTTTLAWILLLWALPGFGLVLYFFAGRNWASKTRKGKVLHDYLAIRTPFMKPIYQRYAEQAEKLQASMAHRFQGRVISGIDQMNDTALLPVVSVDVWPHGSTYFPELIADIRRAEKFVHMQYFIWERDELTEAICDALMDRLKAGVEVRILNDFLGNIQYKKDQLRALRDAGAEWKSDQAQIGRLNYRNHRKITVIDGVIGHTGGFNIGQEYIDGKPKYPYWRDTGVRIVGPGVMRLQELFAARWFEVERESLFTEKYFPRWEGDPGSIMTQVVAHGVEDWWQSSSRAYEIAITAADKRVLDPVAVLRAHREHARGARQHGTLRHRGALHDDRMARQEDRVQRRQDVLASAARGRCARAPLRQGLLPRQVDGGGRRSGRCWDDEPRHPEPRAAQGAHAVGLRRGVRPYQRADLLRRPQGVPRGDAR